jgi:CO dehydrogenase nickel-insertion accessory protein CooC1
MKRDSSNIDATETTVIDDRADYSLKNNIQAMKNRSKSISNLRNGYRRSKSALMSKKKSAKKTGIFEEDFYFDDFMKSQRIKTSHSSLLATG